MWQNLSSQNKIPKNIPKAPAKFYDEWEGWPKFLETMIDYMSYDEAKSFVKSKKILGESSYRKYIKKNKLPKNLPRSVVSYYKKQGTWISWGDFLGTKNISVSIKSKSFLPIKEAKPVYQKLFKEYIITNGNDWKRFAKTHGKLLEELHIPADVLAFYNLEKANAKKRKKQK